MQTDGLGKSKIQGVTKDGYGCRLSAYDPSHGYPTYASVVTFDPFVAIAREEFTGAIWV